VRFVLDEDVSAVVARVLRQKGHDAWTVQRANLSGGGDDEVSVYAHRKGATVLTHDVAFSTRRRLNPIGRHVRLACPEPDGPQVLAPVLDLLVQRIEPFDDVFLYVSREGVSEPHLKWT
jgi:putative transposon-encoded protein